MVQVMLAFAGAEQRQDDLFANENFFSRGKSALKGLKVRASLLPSSLALTQLRRVSRTCTRNILLISPRRSSSSSVVD